VHDDLVRREFTAPAPNRLWLTDITEHPTAEGKLYLCAVKDACSKRIVGYSIDERMTSELAVNALRNAVARRGPADAIMHSDRQPIPLPRLPARPARHRAARLDGSRRYLRRQRPMESFFSLLQKNVLNRRRWATRQDLRLAIIVWIETTYHRRRRQDTRGRLTPIEFEALPQATHAA
jgi:putative transposase